MDLSFTEAEQAFRAEARAWLEDNVPSKPLPSGDTAAGFDAHLEWERTLFDARWAVVSWPDEHGGRGASLVEWLIFEEEYYRAGAPSRVTQNGIFLLAPVLFEYGTDAQKKRFLESMASGADRWAQGWSEPGAGSDLASLRSRAERDEAAGGWRLFGQKTWCTRAAFCTWLHGIFRSNPDSERHKGLTYFLVPLDADGVTVRPVERLDGDPGFAEVFFDGAFVPDDLVVGDVHQGWKVAMTTTSSERGLTLRSPGRFMATAAKLVELARERGELTERLHDQVVEAWIDAQAYRIRTFRTVARMARGEAIGAESSIDKIFWSDLDVRMHDLARQILGPEAILAESAWSGGWQFALAGPIYAGTNEIQRTIIARRLLGLPR